MKKILVVEDEPITRAIICRVCESLGYKAIQTSNGRLVDNLLKENSDFALVITDIIMPDMDGRELVKALRSQEATCSLPIIIISGVIPYKDIRGILELGASRFMPKPLDTSELKRIVTSLLAGEPRLAEHRLQ